MSDFSLTLVLHFKTSKNFNGSWGQVRRFTFPELSIYELWQDCGLFSRMTLQPTNLLLAEPR